jgi:hypothetical protein
MKTIDEHSAILKEISDAAFSYGIDSIGIETYQKEMVNPSKEFAEKFIVRCHDGFKIAQRLLIKEITNYQSLLREKREEIKEARRQRTKEKGITLTQETKVIELRLHSFSHIADGIAWQLIGSQIHIARRLHIDQHTFKYLDSSNFKHAFSVAESINENPLAFALISDLTSFVQIGDLLIKQGSMTGIMELKEGKVNDQIAEFLEELKKKGESLEPENLKVHFDENTVKQIGRVERQKVRAERAIEVINTDKGIDPVSGESITIGTPKIPTETYFNILIKLQEDLKSKIWAYNVVDTCLHIGMYRDLGLMMAPITIKQILESETKNYIIIDWLSITSNLSEPIFMKPFPPDFIIDFLSGKIKIIMGLNLDALINTFNVFGLQTRWLSEKETAKIKQKSPREGMLEINKRGIISSVSKDLDVYIMGGTISKILYDNFLPSNVALTIKEMEIKLK